MRGRGGGRGGEHKASPIPLVAAMSLIRKFFGGPFLLLSTVHFFFSSLNSIFYVFIVIFFFAFLHFVFVFLSLFSFCSSLPPSFSPSLTLCHCPCFSLSIYYFSVSISISISLPLPLSLPFPPLFLSVSFFLSFTVSLTAPCSYYQTSYQSLLLSHHIKPSSLPTAIVPRDVLNLRSRTPDFV